MEYTIPEALDIARELFEQEPSLVNEFAKVELHGLPADPVEAFMFICWKINSVLKTHEQYASFVVSQTAKSAIVGETDSDSSLEVALDPTDKTITQKMKSIVRMMPKLPTLTTPKKVDFYTQNQSAGPPILRQAPSKPQKSPSTISYSPAVAQAHGLALPPATQVNKSSLAKLAEFFGADSEGEVDRILTNMNPETRAIVERSIVGAMARSEDKGGDGGESGGVGDAGDDGDDDDELDLGPKRDSNTPKRAAKLARFFGLPASEDNIGKIRTELRLNSNMNFYRGCIGENVIRINFGTSQFSSSKSLLITNLTTVEECIKILLGKLGIESDPKNYQLLEISPDKTQKVLKSEDYPLQIMSKWNDAKTFWLKKDERLSLDDNDEPAPIKKSQSVGKLADFFGVGVLELESSSLLKALDQLEPSGTFYEIPGIDFRSDEAVDTTGAGQAAAKRSKSRRDTNQVMVKVYLSNRTHKKLSISPQASVVECLQSIAEQMKVNPKHYSLFELRDGAEEKELDGKECLLGLMANWKETKKLLFKKLEHVVESEAEAEAPRESVDDEDDMSIFSIDGEVVVHYGPDNYIGVSVDGETTTKQVIEHMLGILKEDVSQVDKYGIFEVHDSGTTRHLPFDECPLITKLNSLESFKFELKKKEDLPKSDEVPRPLESISEVEGDSEAKRSAASKRTIKLAGFFGVDDSKTEVNKMKLMLGNENAGSMKLTKKRSVIRKGINREGWLEVRRDFEELGKARWQHCWCILNKGELTICLGQRSKNEVVSNEGPQITLSLSNCTISSIPGIKKFAFKIVDQRGLVLEFAANSLQEESKPLPPLLFRVPAWDGGEIKNMAVLLRVKGKCTTDHISAAGPWLKYKGHLDNISNNTLIGALNAENGKVNSAHNIFTKKYDTIPAVARDYKARGVDWMVVADENYGEGSAREHAAMQPRFLGGRVILSKSFARIHETNLKKQGMLPLVFANKVDYERIGSGFLATTIGLRELRPGRTLGLRFVPVEAVGNSPQGSFEVEVMHTMSEDQVEWFKAGSALNMIASQQKQQAQ